MVADKASAMSPLERAEKAMREELKRQMPEIYFWDPSDKDLFDEGEREWPEFQEADGNKKADRFDLAAVARAAIEALREPSEAMVMASVAATLPADPTLFLSTVVRKQWPAMIDALLAETATSAPNPLPRTPDGEV